MGGNDTLSASYGLNQKFYGGDGNDLLTNRASSFTHWAGLGRGGSNVGFYGGNGADTLIGSDGTNYMFKGGNGNDVLTTVNLLGYNNQFFYGGNGNDLLIGSDLRQDSYGLGNTFFFGDDTL